MGKYMNPGNSGFFEILQSEYLDKTGLIDLMNDSIGTKQKLLCVSRPRRFGKSYAAQMLCAYYDFSCDSRELFDDKIIAKSPSYSVHLNQYHVINLDITGFISVAKREGKPLRDIPNRIVDSVFREVTSIYPELAFCQDLSDCLIRCVEQTGRKIVFIIDEWDALIREAKNDSDAQTAYLSLLREWFKNNNFTSLVIAGAYMTGILPIKKDGSQSAISDFLEYPILYPGKFAEYTGFTEKEVYRLCEEYHMDLCEVKAWYDGYDFSELGSIYNPYSVMQAVRNRKCRSYWKKTSAAESLLTYINMNYDGLQEILTRLISGEEMEVDVDGFENDFETFHNKDDILTLLIHLGYLTFCETGKTVRIPNEEVKSEFKNILKGKDVSAKWVDLLRKSKILLEDTIAGKEDAVAERISEIRETEYAPTYYNDEQALRYVIKFSYIAAMDQYLKVEEMPSGHGIADVVYIPKRRSILPVLIIELKWNQSSGGAIAQIKDRNYPAVLQDYGGEILLAGINYDEKTKRHSCRIERICKK